MSSAKQQLYDLNGQIGRLNKVYPVTNEEALIFKFYNAFRKTTDIILQEHFELLPALGDVCLKFITFLIKNTRELLQFTKGWRDLSIMFDYLMNIGKYNVNNNENESILIYIGRQVLEIIVTNENLLLNKILLRSFLKAIRYIEIKDRVAMIPDNNFIKKLCTTLQLCGDFEYQTLILELLFRLNKIEDIQNNVKQWILNETLQEKLLKIDFPNYDASSTEFLRLVNDYSKTVYSLFVEFAYIAGQQIIPGIKTPGEFGMWVYFNSLSRSIEIHSHKSLGGAKNSAKEFGWITIMVLFNNVTMLSHKMSKEQGLLEIEFQLMGEVLSWVEIPEYIAHATSLVFKVKKNIGEAFIPIIEDLFNDEEEEEDDDEEINQIYESQVPAITECRRILSNVERTVSRCSTVSSGIHNLHRAIYTEDEESEGDDIEIVSEKRPLKSILKKTTSITSPEAQEIVSIPKHNFQSHFNKTVATEERFTNVWENSKNLHLTSPISLITEQKSKTKSNTFTTIPSSRSIYHSIESNNNNLPPPKYLSQNDRSRMQRIEDDLASVDVEIIPDSLEENNNQELISDLRYNPQTLRIVQSFQQNSSSCEGGEDMDNDIEIKRPIQLMDDDTADFSGADDSITKEISRGEDDFFLTGIRVAKNIDSDTIVMSSQISEEFYEEEEKEAEEHNTQTQNYSLQNNVSNSRDFYQIPEIQEEILERSKTKNKNLKIKDDKMKNDKEKTRRPAHNRAQDKISQNKGINDYQVKEKTKKPAHNKDKEIKDQADNEKNSLKLEEFNNKTNNILNNETINESMLINESEIVDSSIRDSQLDATLFSTSIPSLDKSGKKQTDITANETIVDVDKNQENVAAATVKESSITKDDETQDKEEKEIEIAKEIEDRNKINRGKKEKEITAAKKVQEDQDENKANKGKKSDKELAVNVAVKDNKSQSKKHVDIIANVVIDGGYKIRAKKNQESAVVKDNKIIKEDDKAASDKKLKESAAAKDDNIKEGEKGDKTSGKKQLKESVAKESNVSEKITTQAKKSKLSTVKKSISEEPAKNQDKKQAEIAAANSNNKIIKDGNKAKDNKKQKESAIKNVIRKRGNKRQEIEIITKEVIEGEGGEQGGEVLNAILSKNNSNKETQAIIKEIMPIKDKLLKKQAADDTESDNNHGWTPLRRGRKKKTLATVLTNVDEKPPLGLKRSVRIEERKKQQISKKETFAIIFGKRNTKKLNDSSSCDKTDKELPPKQIENNKITEKIVDKELNVIEDRFEDNHNNKDNKNMEESKNKRIIKASTSSETTDDLDDKLQELFQEKSLNEAKKNTSLLDNEFFSAITQQIDLKELCPVTVQIEKLPDIDFNNLKNGISNAIEKQGEAEKTESNNKVNTDNKARVRQRKPKRRKTILDIEEESTDNENNKNLLVEQNININNENVKDKININDNIPEHEELNERTTTPIKINEENKETGNQNSTKIIVHAEVLNENVEDTSFTLNGSLNNVKIVNGSIFKKKRRRLLDLSELNTFNGSNTSLLDTSSVLNTSKLDKCRSNIFSPNTSVDAKPKAMPTQKNKSVIDDLDKIEIVSEDPNKQKIENRSTFLPKSLQNLHADKNKENVSHSNRSTHTELQVQVHEQTSINEEEQQSAEKLNSQVLTPTKQVMLDKVFSKQLTDKNKNREKEREKPEKKRRGRKPSKPANDTKIIKPLAVKPKVDNSLSSTIDEIYEKLKKSKKNDEEGIPWLFAKPNRDSSNNKTLNSTLGKKSLFDKLISEVGKPTLNSKGINKYKKKIMDKSKESRKSITDSTTKSRGNKRKSNEQEEQKTKRKRSNEASTKKETVVKRNQSPPHLSNALDENINDIPMRNLSPPHLTHALEEAKTNKSSKEKETLKKLPINLQKIKIENIQSKYFVKQRVLDSPPSTPIALDAEEESLIDISPNELNKDEEHYLRVSGEENNNCEERLTKIEGWLKKVNFSDEAFLIKQKANDFLSLSTSLMDLFLIFLNSCGDHEAERLMNVMQDINDRIKKFKNDEESIQNEKLSQ